MRKRTHSTARRRRKREPVAHISYGVVSRELGTEGLLRSTDGEEVYDEVNEVYRYEVIEKESLERASQVVGNFMKIARAALRARYRAADVRLHLDEVQGCEVEPADRLEEVERFIASRFETWLSKANQTAIG